LVARASEFVELDRYAETSHGQADLDLLKERGEDQEGHRVHHERE
jgi:hypothetical protein